MRPHISLLPSGKQGTTHGQHNEHEEHRREHPECRSSGQGHCPSQKTSPRDDASSKSFTDHPVTCGAVRTEGPRGEAGQGCSCHSPQEVAGHGRVCRELPVVHGVRGPLHDGVVHPVLHGQCPYHRGTVLLSQTLHQAKRQPSPRSPAPGEMRSQEGGSGSTGGPLTSEPDLRVREWSAEQRPPTLPTS